MEKPSTARIALKWGLITSIIIIIYSVILFISGQFKNQALTLISYLFLLGGIIMAMREFKSMNNEFMTFGEGLGLGTLTSAVTGLIGSIFGVIYMNYVDTTIMQQISDMQREQFEAKGMSSEQIDQALEMAAKFSSPGMLFVFGLLGYLFIGFILSLITSAILKKNKPELEF